MLREQTYPGQYAPSEEDPELFREHIGDTYISCRSGDPLMLCRRSLHRDALPADYVRRRRRGHYL